MKKNKLKLMAAKLVVLVALTATVFGQEEPFYDGNGPKTPPSGPAIDLICYFACIVTLPRETCWQICHRN